MGVMKTKTLLIHLAAATLGVSAMAGNPHGGAPHGFKGGDMKHGRGGVPVYVAPGRGASAWAPGHGRNLPPGHGGVPPGQAKKQERTFWGGFWGNPRNWFGR